jgi:hypothetical protein
MRVRQPTKKNARHPVALPLALMTAAVSLSGCTLADHFGPRAVAYNIEAEDARDQNILLNVVRAAYRKPMQFTDLTAAVGTATTSGTLGSSLVIGPHQSGAASTISPSMTVSGGPTFTINTFNTKEFYSGILTPIGDSLAAYFASIGIQKQILYTLLFGEIDINGRTLSNHAANQQEWDKFQDALKALIDAGLTTEIRQPGYFGPELPAASLQDPAKLAALAKEKIDLVPAKLSRAGEPVTWHAVKDGPKPAFCFEGTSSSVSLAGSTAQIDPGAHCGQNRGHRKAEEPSTTRTLAPGLTVRVRSVEGVIYFLGEIARSELGLDATQPARVEPRIWFGPAAPGSTPDILFSVQRSGGPDSISTMYSGTTYSSPVDPANLNHSAQVLELVLQLLALNSSSKDLPSPGLVTLVGH